MSVQCGACWCVVVWFWVWLCGGPTRVSPDAAFSSLLHHLPGADMCVAHAVKITVYKKMYMYTHIYIIYIHI